MSGETCSSEPCSAVASYDEAINICSNRGKRLCFNDEQTHCCGTGCGYDGMSVWVGNREPGTYSLFNFIDFITKTLDKYGI